jgi:hypothetical protein
MTSVIALQATPPVPGLSEPGYTHSDVVAEVDDLGDRIHLIQPDSTSQSACGIIPLRPPRLTAFALKTPS